MAKTMQILVVGGGGGGTGWEAGYGAGGGGGGGGYKEVLAQEVLAGSYTITVGNGGSRAWGQGTVGGQSGGASSFGTLISVSGGGGGAGSEQTTGKTGGSGGGGFMNGGIGGSAISGQGYPGGTSSNPSNYRASGGGGAGSAGGNATESSGGDGGNGKASSITGTSIYRSAGGAGGCTWNPQNYNGIGYGNAGSGGQGGGGGVSAESGQRGVVIVRYLTTDFGTCTGGTKTTDGNYTVHEFTTSGTFVVTTAPVLTTQDCSVVGSVKVKANGTITSTGGETVTERGFCYKAGTSGDPTTADDTVSDTGSFSTGAFSKAITGLTPNTYYRVRAYAVNSVGTSYGVTYTVLTASVYTSTATYIKTVSLTANATTSSSPSTTYSRRGFCYIEGTSGDPETTDNIEYEDGTFLNEAYSLVISGLTENTNYRLRAYVIDVNGSITYGDTIQILTETTPTSSGSFITLLNR